MSDSISVSVVVIVVVVEGVVEVLVVVVVVVVASTKYTVASRFTQSLQHLSDIRRAPTPVPSVWCRTTASP